MKTKNIKISEDVHRDLKIFCAIKNLKIKNYIENMILKNIQEHEKKD